MSKVPSETWQRSRQISQVAGSYILSRRYMILSLQVFAFKEQNVMFIVNVLLTCILYCDAQARL